MTTTHRGPLWALAAMYRIKCTGASAEDNAVLGAFSHHCLISSCVRCVHRETSAARFCTAHAGRARTQTRLPSPPPLESCKPLQHQTSKTVPHTGAARKRALNVWLRQHRQGTPFVTCSVKSLTSAGPCRRMSRHHRTLRH